jgi:hypothetical protein
MRKILLATTALVGFAVAGAAQAATSPLTVTVGGDVDFVAGAFHSSEASAPRTDSSNGSFETLYDLNFGVAGKAGNGLEYGGTLSLNNNPDISNYFRGNSNGIEVTTADLFLSGAFGKVQLGDSQGATDLAVGTPTVGEGQVNGRYIDFLNTLTFAKTFVTGIDGTDHSTNITYYTPKVGNDTNKVQAGVTFAPNFYNYGSNSVQFENNNGLSRTIGGTTYTYTGGTDQLSPYKDVIKGALNYTGTFKPVTLGVSGTIISGTADASGSNLGWLATAPGGKDRDFTAYGIGATAAAEGFTLGGNYTDLGNYDTVGAQNKDQQQYGAGLKYEFSKVAVGVSYLGGEGYDNTLLLPVGKTGAGSSYNYVKDFDSYGLGGAYTWAPGLTTNADAVLFDQKTESDVKNDGYVLLISQKLAF